MYSSDRLNSSKDANVAKKLYVRYMLSLRCKTIVQKELDHLKLKYSLLSFGAIQFPAEVGQKELKALKRNLRKSGLDLLDHHESILVDRVISTILEVIHSFDELPNLSYSEIISKNLSEANDSVLKIFSEVVGMSVIQFIVAQKIERVKELLLYHDILLPDIANHLRYKSERHLIAQFKKITGLTPYHFMKLKEERAKVILQSLQESEKKKSVKIKPAS